VCVRKRESARARRDTHIHAYVPKCTHLPQETCAHTYAHTHTYAHSDLRAGIARLISARISLPPSLPPSLSLYFSLSSTHPHHACGLLIYNIPFFFWCGFAGISVHGRHEHLSLMIFYIIYCYYYHDINLYALLYIGISVHGREEHVSLIICYIVY
jgi:hypothetical protein